MKLNQQKSVPLLLVLTLFTVSFFIYRDFGLRMLLGFGILCLFLGAELIKRLSDGSALAPHSVPGAMLWLAAVIAVNFLRPDSQHSADTISYVISMTVCTGFVWLWRKNSRESAWILKLLLGAAVALTALVLLYMVFPEPIYNLLYPRVSPVAQNYFDYFLPKGYGFCLGGYTFTDYIIFCGIAVCWGKIAAAKKRSVKDLLWLGLIFVFGFAILALGRRGELLGAVVLCVAMVLLLASPKMRLVLILGGGGLILLFLWLFIEFLPQFKEIDIFYRYVRTVENLLNGYDFTSGRTGLYALAIAGFQSAPLFGIGFDQFYTLVNPLLTDIEGNVMQDAHNIYLQMLCETGIVGTVLTLLPLFWLLFTTFRSLQAARKREDRAGTEPLTVSLLIQGYLLFLGLLDPTFQKIVFWCFYGIAAMLLMVGMDQQKTAGPLSALFERVSKLVTIPLNLLWRKKDR